MGKSSFNLFEGKRRRMSLCLAWEEAKSTLGHFCPVSSYMNWKAKSRFNASFLRPRTTPLCSPVKLISEELHNFLWDIALQMCHGETRLAVLPSPRVQEWALYCWTENDTLCSDPHWGSQVDKLPAKRRGCGQWMCVWFCFVPLWICLVIYRAKGKARGQSVAQCFANCTPGNPSKGWRPWKAGSRG